VSLICHMSHIIPWITPWQPPLRREVLLLWHMGLLLWHMEHMSHICPVCHKRSTSRRGGGCHGVIQGTVYQCVSVLMDTHTHTHTHTNTQTHKHTNTQTQVELKEPMVLYHQEHARSRASADCPPQATTCQESSLSLIWHMSHSGTYANAFRTSADCSPQATSSQKTSIS